jgi:hypothetical protein
MQSAACPAGRLVTVEEVSSSIMRGPAGGRSGLGVEVAGSPLMRSGQQVDLGWDGLPELYSSSSTPQPTGQAAIASATPQLQALYLCTRLGKRGHMRRHADCLQAPC